MNTTQAHTATPWRCSIEFEKRDSGDNLYTRFRIDGKDGCRTVASCPVTAVREYLEEHQANAEMIVRAVNSHDALVASCKELLAMVEEMLPKHGPCGWGQLAVEQARAAIEQATK